MAHFLFVVFAAEDGAGEELSGEYSDVAHALHEAKRFLFDVGHEIFTRVNGGEVRVQVHDAAGAVVYDATLAYAVNSAGQVPAVTY